MDGAVIEKQTIETLGLMIANSSTAKPLSQCLATTGHNRLKFPEVLH
jgi:hypothetical protein